MSSPNSRGPKPLSDILGELFASRGYGRLRAQRELEEAWNGAVGEPGCRLTRLGEVRRGILNVTVAHSTLLAELASFQKPQLLAALRQNAPGTVVHDIRFRVGPIESPAVEPETEGEPGLSAKSKSKANAKPRSTSTSSRPKKTRPPRPESDE